MTRNRQHHYQRVERWRRPDKHLSCQTGLGHKLTIASYDTQFGKVLGPPSREVRFATVHVWCAGLNPPGAGEYCGLQRVARILNRELGRGRLVDAGGWEGNLYRLLKAELRSDYTVVDAERTGAGRRLVSKLASIPLLDGTAQRA